MSTRPRRSTGHVARVALLTGCALLGSAGAGCGPQSASAASSGAPPSPAGIWRLTGARVLSADGTAWREGVIVVVSGDTIQSVEATQHARPHDGVDGSSLDATGLYLIPGLIDLHTHLLLHPYDEALWNDQVLKESLELRTIRAVTAAAATVRAGFTTIRDLGTEGAGFADVALRDAIASGMIVGPRVFAATRAIVATGCYGPAGFDPRWVLPKGAQEADGVDGVRKAVREQIAAGADWVKFYADYRRTPGSAATATFSLAEMQAMVDEASSAGVPAAAHATTEEGIRRAALAGVRTIEHGTGATLAVLQLMRTHDVALCPTLAAVEASARYAGWKPGEPEPARVQEARELMRRAVRAGVRLACGSDAGVFAHGDNAHELELMADYGLSAGAVLRSATVTAAAVLGRAHDLGAIAAGFRADLVGVRGDPLRDTRALREPVLVVKGGRLMVDARQAKP